MAAAPDDRRTPRAARPVRDNLALFALALVLPALAFVGFVLWQYANAERTRLEAQAVETARSVALAIDRDLTGLRTALDVLALSPRLQEGDLQGFHDDVRGIEQRLGLAALLRDPSGRPLVDARETYGPSASPLPIPVDGQVIATGEPRISDLLASGSEPRFAVVAPVFREGTREILYLLALTPSVERLRRVLMDEARSEAWTVAVVDREGLIMARSERHEAFVGRRATQDLLDSTRGDRGTWRGTTADGRAVLGAFQRSGLAQWRIAVGIRSADLDRPLMRSLGLMAALGLCLGALAILLAMLFGRRIAEPLAVLRGHARALGAGEPVAAFRSPLREANEVGDELLAASERLAERAEERDRALKSYREETLRLDVLNRAAAVLAAELDLERLVETIIEAATNLIGARYGAFFERVAGEGEADEHWRLFGLTGAPAEAFTRFGLPRPTGLFAPTFDASGVVRADDVLADPRYGSLGGMPEGHLPVRSYLAMPVVSRSGERLGALLFGHPDPGVFGEREESLLQGFAGQAAIALDNARLFRAARAEIDQRRAAEAALEAERARAEAAAAERSAILGQLAEGVIVTDRDGRIIFVNEAAARLHGVARLDVAPEEYAETYSLLTEDGQPHPFEDLPLVRAVTRAETVLDARWRIRRPDRTEVLAIGSARPLFTAEGRRLGSVLTVRDDTQRTASERSLQDLTQALAERAADLKESNDEIQRYAYIVSHDLRAPLVNIMGFTSELETVKEEILAELRDSARRSDIDRDLTESIGFIKAATIKMEGLIAAILKLSREGRRTFRPEPLAMQALVQGIVDAQRHQMEEAGATVVVGELPDLVADRLAVEQILGNLIDNAGKYLSPGRPGRIEITGERVGPLVRMRVKDNGRGIAPHDHQRVFELFRRSGQQDRAGEGIGLAHVRALVRSLGGRIDLSSELNVGTTFTVTLPASPLPEAGSGVDVA